MVHVHYTALPYILAAIATVHAGRPAPVKGVAPENYKLYSPISTGGKNQWQCLDGSKVIPHAAINDDYCDCPDGSDEPGTSACPNSVFYCQNAGHIPSYIKSYAVNDGVCDEACCDGSDETSGLISCPNRCREVALAYQKSKALFNEIQAAGIAAKNKLIAQGLKQVSDWETEKAKYEEMLAIRRAELLRRQSEIDQLQGKVTAQQPRKKSVKCSPCKTSTKDKEKIDMLKAHITTLQDQVEELVAILRDMKRDHNHNFHDLAVKSAITGYDEFIVEYGDLKAEINEDLEMLDAQEDQPEEEEEVEDVSDVDTTEEQSQEDKVEAPKQESTSTGPGSLLHTVWTKIEPFVPPAWRPKIDELISPKTRSSGESGSHEESEALEAARKSSSDLETDIQSMENSLKTINENLSKDFGPEYEWLALKDHCVEKNEGEYTYSLCLFGEAHQKSNKDGVRVNLGRFDKFLGEQHAEQTYTHGARCWNGPERSVHVVFECGKETEIVEVTEPQKCEYKYRAKTPAVCTTSQPPESFVTSPEAAKPKVDVYHEEL